MLSHLSKSPGAFYEGCLVVQTSIPKDQNDQGPRHPSHLGEKYLNTGSSVCLTNLKVLLIPLLEHAGAHNAHQAGQCQQSEFTLLTL